MLALFLAEAVGQVSRVLLLGQSRDECRQRASTLLTFMGRELQAAVVPFNQITSSSPATPSQPYSLQFLINPPAVSNPSRDTLFWQAPVASDRSFGDLAEVGYFLQWDTSSSSNPRANLCRYFVNPSSANYLIYSQPLEWLPASFPVPSKSNQYQGLFLENVMGIWVRAYSADGTPYDPQDITGFDSRQPPADNLGVRHPLPASVEVALVVLNSAAANRLTSRDMATIQQLYPGVVATVSTTSSLAADTAHAFISRLAAPLQAGADVVSIRVTLNNYR